LKKIVLVSSRGYTVELDRLVKHWIADGVKYVGVIGVDASKIDDIIDEICVGDGSEPYSMLTAFHDGDETLEDAVAHAEQISDELGTSIEVVKLL
jgi:hypothetical protein